jgi:hypothetical protein
VAPAWTRAGGRGPAWAALAGLLAERGVTV